MKKGKLFIWRCLIKYFVLRRYLLTNNEKFLVDKFKALLVIMIRAYKLMVDKTRAWRRLFVDFARTLKGGTGGFGTYKNFLHFS